MNTGKTSWDDLKKRRNINVAKWARRHQPQTFEHLNKILYKMSVRPLRFDHEDMSLLLSYSLKDRVLPHIRALESVRENIEKLQESRSSEPPPQPEIPKEETINVDDIVDYKTDKKLEAKEFNKFLSNSGFKQNTQEAATEEEIDDKSDILEDDYQNEDDE
jgi:hypothetical protein